MSSEDEDDFPLFAPLRPLTPRERYEFLLRVVRYLLARQVSFTQIEEALVAGGVAPDTAEQLVELVIQDLEGVQRPPRLYSETDVPVNALLALGFVADTRDARAGSLLAVARGTDPAPEFAFADGATPSLLAARTRHRGASVKLLLMTAAVVLAVLVGLALVLF